MAIIRGKNRKIKNAILHLALVSWNLEQKREEKNEHKQKGGFLNPLPLQGGGREEKPFEDCLPILCLWTSATSIKERTRL